MPFREDCCTDFISITWHYFVNVWSGATPRLGGDYRAKLKFTQKGKSSHYLVIPRPIESWVFWVFYHCCIGTFTWENRSEYFFCVTQYFIHSVHIRVRWSFKMINWKQSRANVQPFLCTLYYVQIIQSKLNLTDRPWSAKGTGSWTCNLHTSKHFIRAQQGDIGSQCVMPRAKLSIST